MEQIVKTGIISSIKGKNISVKISSCSACQGCAVKSYCGMSETKDKEISVFNEKTEDYNIGERVDLILDAAVGFRAVFFCYVLPLILLLIAVITAKWLNLNDFYSGICAIFILIPYYLGVFLLRNKIKTKFRFEIVKRIYS